MLYGNRTTCIKKLIESHYFTNYTRSFMLKANNAGRSMQSMSISLKRNKWRLYWYYNNESWGETTYYIDINTNFKNGYKIIAHTWVPTRFQMMRFQRQCRYGSRRLCYIRIVTGRLCRINYIACISYQICTLLQNDKKTVQKY